MQRKADNLNNQTNERNSNKSKEEKFKKWNIKNRISKGGILALTFG